VTLVCNDTIYCVPSSTLEPSSTISIGSGNETYCLRVHGLLEHKHEGNTQWISSSDVSGYHADFHEGHGTLGAGQGRGMACVN
jgi:hypothetical protein